MKRRPVGETAMNRDPIAGSCDLVVVGGGIAGLTAALAAAQRGADVILVEKGEALGGSWHSSIRTMAIYQPQAVQPLNECVSIPRAVDWLRRSGCAVRSRRDGDQESITPDGGSAMLVQWFTDAIQAAGGRVYLDHRGTRVVMSGTSVRGLVVASRSRATEVRCRAVILCTGGFGANPEMLSRYLGPWGDRLIARCGTGSTGDGIQMGLDVGAAASHGLSSIHGHPMVLKAGDTPEDSQGTVLFEPANGVLFNRLGRRFIDEASTTVAVNQELVFQPEARGYLIVDAASRSAGAPGAIRCQTLDEVREALYAQGAYGRGAVETILDAHTSGALMSDGRPAGSWSLGTPPFAVLPVAASVTWTRGGLLTTSEGTVLDRQASQIPGLLAAGTDAGDSSEDYVGGAAWALVSGLEAGVTASRFAAGTRATGSHRARDRLPPTEPRR